MMTIELEREADGRWIGAVPELPGVMAYGATEEEARAKAAALALRVIADRIEHGEPAPSSPLTLPSPPTGGRGLRRVGEGNPSLTRSWVRGVAV